MSERKATPSKFIFGPVGRLPESGYIRQAELIGKPKAGVPAIVPVSSATLWRMVKAGDFPPPVKLSQRVTAWPVESVRSWMADRSVQQAT